MDMMKVDFSNVVFARTLHYPFNPDTTVQVLLQAYPFGVNKQTQVLCHLHSYKNEQKMYQCLGDCAELTVKDIKWLANPLNLCSEQDTPEFKVTSSVLIDKVELITKAGEPLITDFYERPDFKDLKLSPPVITYLTRAAYRELRELAPTIKFIMDAYKTKAKIPTIEICMIALTEHIVSRKFLKDGLIMQESYGSFLYNNFFDIKERVEDEMDVFQKTLGFNPKLVVACFDHLYQVSNITRHLIDSTLKTIISNILLNEAYLFV